jgi:hypothetical protein
MDIFEPMMSSSPILHRHLHCLQMDQNKIPHDPRHLGVPSGVSKTISNPMRCLAQTMHLLAPTLTLSPNVPKQDSTWPMSPRSSIGCIKNDFWAYATFGTNCAPILRQDFHYLQTKWIELPLEPRHLVVPTGVSKMIFETMTCLAQTVDVSCTDTNTVSKWTKTRFYLTHIT